MGFLRKLERLPRMFERLPRLLLPGGVIALLVMHGGGEMGVRCLVVELGGSAV